MRTGRLEAFSDGVIAIAITLLILDIGVPDVRAGDLGPALIEQWPSYIAYAVTFLVIGIMWVNHHTLFDQLRTVDRPLVFINLGLLGSIAFLPFSTGLLAEYLLSTGGGSIAAAVYSGSLLVVAAWFLALWAYIGRHPSLLSPDAPPDLVARALRRSIVGPLVYAGAVAVAFVNPVLCLSLHALVAGWYILPARGLRQAALP